MIKLGVCGSTKDYTYPFFDKDNSSSKIILRLHYKISGACIIKIKHIYLSLNHGQLMSECNLMNEIPDVGSP